MGAWGSGLLDNDGAADFVGDVRDLAPAQRLLRLLDALQAVTRSVTYLDAPTAEQAAAAALLMAAAWNTALAPTAADVTATIDRPAPADVLIALAALARLRNATDNEWLELWAEAGESATVLAELDRVEDALRTGAPEPVRVVFLLDVDADGWPPVRSESVWSKPAGDDRYEIDNVPWFVRDLAVGDVVSAVAPEADALPAFQNLISRSAHVTVRVICARNGPLAGELQPVLDAFVPLGVYAEGASQYRMVALDIPPEAGLRAIYERLTAGQLDGSWEWEEGRISADWEAVKAALPRKRGLFRRN